MLPTTGELSMSQIAAELGISPTGLSLNDPRLRALVGVPTGEIRMSMFRGVGRIAITSPVNNLNLFVRAGYPNYPGTFIFDISAVIGSTGYQTPALSVGQFPTGATIIINNNSNILGAGGPGGGYYSAGLQGGMAIQANWPNQSVIINNRGLIYGGGGGGGSGGYGGAGGTGGAGYYTVGSINWQYSQSSYAWVFHAHLDRGPATISTETYLIWGGVNQGTILSTPPIYNPGWGIGGTPSGVNGPTSYGIWRRGSLVTVSGGSEDDNDYYEFYQIGQYTESNVITAGGVGGVAIAGGAGGYGQGSNIAAQGGAGASYNPGAGGGTNAGAGGRSGYGGTGGSGGGWGAAGATGNTGETGAQGGYGNWGGAGAGGQAGIVGAGGGAAGYYLYKAGQNVVLNNYNSVAGLLG